MMGIAEEPPHQLAPPVGIATLDFVIRAGSVEFIINDAKNFKFISNIFSKIGRSEFRIAFDT